MDIVDSGPNLGVYVDLDGHLRVRSLPDLHKALDEAGANWWEVPELQCDRVSPKKVTTAEADLALISGVITPSTNRFLSVSRVKYCTSASVSRNESCAAACNLFSSLFKQPFCDEK